MALFIMEGMDPDVVPARKGLTDTDEVLDHIDATLAGASYDTMSWDAMRWSPDAEEPFDPVMGHGTGRPLGITPDYRAAIDLSPYIEDVIAARPRYVVEYQATPMHPDTARALQEWQAFLPQVRMATRLLSAQFATARAGVIAASNAIAAFNHAAREARAREVAARPPVPKPSTTPPMWADHHRRRR